MIKRSTIGYYDESINESGTTRYLLELFKHLDRSRYDPVFFAVHKYKWHDKLSDLGVHIIYGNDNTDSQKIVHDDTVLNGNKYSLFKKVIPQSVKWTAGIIKETIILKSLFSKYPFDILHTNNTGAEIAPIAARLAGIKYITGTLHVDPSIDILKERDSLRFRILEHISIRSLHHIISVSYATLEAWKNRCHLNKRIYMDSSVIYNGVDVDGLLRQQNIYDARSMLGLPKNKTIIGCVGRLELIKGYHDAIYAIAEIVQKHPDVLLAIAGNGPFKKELEQLIDKLGLSSNVMFLGHIDPINRFYECIDIYFHPSLCEAFPFAILEAGAMGLPCVASSVGGVSEAIIDGVTGYLVSARNIQKYIEKLCLLIEDKQLRMEMGRYAAEYVKHHYSSSKMAINTITIYDKLLNNKSKNTILLNTHANPSGT